MINDIIIWRCPICGYLAKVGNTAIYHHELSDCPECGEEMEDRRDSDYWDYMKEARQSQADEQKYEDSKLTGFRGRKCGR